MEKILSSPLREKSGSDSYNRFEYQVHWIVYHMLDNFKKQNDFVVFCEFHDDMTRMNSVSSECMEFFQVKTRDTHKKWTLASLLGREKRANGSRKNSFLGFIFYNFLKFSKGCSRCYFISNEEFDGKILTWQSIVKDNHLLKQKDNSLYNEIKELLRKEFDEIEQKEFNNVFDRFIQYTHISKTPLNLNTYEEQIKGIFFEISSEFDLSTSVGLNLLTSIITEVRNKSKTIIQTPISLIDLNEKKGISSNVFNKLGDSFRTISKQMGSKEKVRAFLKDNGSNDLQINVILKKLNKHHEKSLDISDKLYQDSLVCFANMTNDLIEKNFDNLTEFDTVNNLMESIIEPFLKSHKHIDIDEFLLRGVFYETILST